MHDREQKRPMKPSGVPSILIATPVMNSASHLSKYWENVRKLTFPHSAISVAFLDDDITRNGSTWRK
jgi:hypothetical protein